MAERAPGGWKSTDFGIAFSLRFSKVATLFAVLAPAGNRGVSVAPVVCAPPKKENAGKVREPLAWVGNIYWSSVKRQLQIAKNHTRSLQFNYKISTALSASDISQANKL